MIDLDYLRQWVGREEVKSEPVSEAFIERFCATFDLDRTPRLGEAAPIMVHFCLAPPAAPTSELGGDGHPARGGFLPPVPLPRRMWAGGALQFHDDINIGETVTRHSVIRDVALKEGRSGALCFVTVDHRIESGGRHILSERQDIVYRGREVAQGVGVKPAAATEQGMHRERVTPSAALLFRYSALTFNGHRIHYDAPYTTGTEGYSGLIVHGPLQASMLVQFAEKLQGARPKSFEFRSLSPLFDISDFTLNAAMTNDGMRLWTSYVDGPVAMEAQARW